jgi:hypothetical protein
MPMANPSEHPAISVPYPFRPFWQPNSRAFSPMPLHQGIPQLERLTQKLDKAEKKIDEYLRLSGFTTNSINCNKGLPFICSRIALR